MGLGANQYGPAGLPMQTLTAVRPLLQEVLDAWAPSGSGERPSSLLTFSWSPLLQTEPVGGPTHQPTYLNAVLLVRGIGVTPELQAALTLLDEFQHLERCFGRNRSEEERWGPRSLDLDFLFWGELRLDHHRIKLPHPRLHLRNFVLEPLLAAMKGSTEWIL
mgnify:CR=1 FL=1